MSENALAIFAKWPIAGQVKTRLCPPLSPEQAAELARCFLLDTVSRVSTLTEADVCLAFTPPDSESRFRGFLPFRLRYLAQRGASLGERELNVFGDLLSREWTRVAIMGSDVPTVPLQHVRSAFALLRDPRCDVVLGPSSDGGYYLIGAKRALPQLFSGVAWGTAHVMRQTLSRARQHAIRISQIPEWHDVDTEADLNRLAAVIGGPGGARSAPKTSAFLKELGLC